MINKIGNKRPGFVNRNTIPRQRPTWLDNKLATHYEVLGVDPRANAAQIKQAYRYLALKWHPDRNHSKIAEAVFKRISDAYNVLSDQDKRKEYNRSIRLAEKPGTTNVSDMFTEQDLDHFRNIFADLKKKRTQEMMAMLNAAGLGPSSWGERVLTHLQWRRSGELVLGSIEGANYDCHAEISIFDLIRQPLGLKFDQEQSIALGNYGTCWQIIPNPVNNQLAINVAPRGSSYEGKKYPRVIMAFEWNKLMASREAWHKFKEDGRNAYALWELEGRDAFSKEGLTALPGCPACLVLHEKSQPVIKWSLDGKKLIIVDSNDGTATNWDLRNNSCAISQLFLNDQDPKYNEKPQVTLSPGGLFAAFSYSSGIVLPEADKKFVRTEPFVEIRDLESGQVMARLDDVCAMFVNWSATGDLFFEKRDGPPGDSHGIFMWDWQNNALEQITPPIEGGIHELSLNPPTGYLAIGGPDGKVRVINTSNRKLVDCLCLANYRVATSITLNNNEIGRAGGIRSLAWSPDGGLIAAGHLGNLTIWEIKRPKQISLT